MSQENPSLARAWLIRTTEIPPFIYDPLVHSREYVTAYLQETGASDAEVANVMAQVKELEQRAAVFMED